MFAVRRYTYYDKFFKYFKKLNQNNQKKYPSKIKMSTFYSASKNNMSNSKQKTANNFRKKNQEFEILEKDFPSLVSDVSNKEENILDYKAAVIYENSSVQTEKNELSKGWVRIYFEDGESGKITQEYNENSLEDEESFHFQTLCALDKLHDSWESYRNNYNILYGENAYEKIYSNYFDMYYISDIESDDEE